LVRADFPDEIFNQLMRNLMLLFIIFFSMFVAFPEYHLLARVGTWKNFMGKVRKERVLWPFNNQWLWVSHCTFKVCHVKKLTWS